MEVFLLLLLLAAYIAIKVVIGGAQDPLVRDRKKFTAGITMVRNKEWEKGFLYFNAMISESPKSATAWLYRGKCQQGLKNYYAAIADFTKASDLDYNVSEAYLDKAKLLMELEEFEQALEAAEKAAWHMRNNGEAYRVRGEVLMKLGINGKAVMDFRKAVSMGDENASYYLRKHFNLHS